MANKTRSTRTLSMSSIQTVDGNGEVVTSPDVMKEIAAEVKFDAGAGRILTSEVLESVQLDLGALGTVPMDIRKPFPKYGTAYTIGVLKGAHKWHLYDHYQIMGVLNGAASLRLGHYALVEEGLHLKQTFETVRKGKIYEGTFGYVCFEKMPADWLKEFESRNIVPQPGHVDDWMKLVIKNQRVTFGHWVAPVSLDSLAAKLERKVEELSPVTLANYREAWNTWHKRNGVEAVLRASRGETHIVMALRTIKGKEWQIGVESRRALYLAGPDKAALAKAMGDAAAGAEAQLGADQEGFITQGTPAETVEAAAAKVGKLVTYGGTEYEPKQLVRAAVMQMRGDMEVARLYLRDLSMVIRQFETAANSGMTLKVIKLAE